MNTKTLSFVVWALALFMVACSDSSTYTNVIPKEASIVVSADLLQIAEKGELTGDDGRMLAEKIGKSISGEMGNQENGIINKIVANPNESGLDFKKNVYLFATQKFENSGLLVSVSDYGKLSKFTELFVEQKVCEPFSEEEGIRFSVVNEKTLIAYDEDAFLVLFAEANTSSDKLKELAWRWLANEKENSYVATEEFKKMTAPKADIAMAMSLDCMLEYNNPIYSLLMPQNLSLKDMVGIYALNFEKGKVQVDMDMLYKSDEAKEYAKIQEKIYAGQLKGKFLDRIQGNTVMYLAGTCNGEEVYSLLMENELVKSQLNSGKMPADMKTVLGSLKGEIVLAVAEGQMMPQVALYAEVKDDKILKELEDYKAVMDIAKVKYGVEDNVLYISNMESPESGKSLEDTGMAADSNGKVMYFTVDFKSLSNLFNVLGGGMKAQQMSMVAEYVKSFTMYFDNTMNNSHMILCTTNEDVNVMKQIVDLSKKMSGMQ